MSKVSWYLQLLIDVLPAFVAVARFVALGDDQTAEDLRRDLEGKLPKNYYVLFYTEVFNLHAVSSDWDWANSPREDTERILRKTLDELESRFRSTSVLEQLGWSLYPNEPYSKLQALRRKLQAAAVSNLQDRELDDGDNEDGELDDPVQRLQEEQYLRVLKGVVHVASRAERYRIQALHRLRAGFNHLIDLSHPTVDGPSSHVSIAQYPSKHVRKCATSFFRLLQRHWSSCKCAGYETHRNRKTQLSLAAHRRFGTTPSPENVHKATNVNTEATFQVLLPTTSEFLKWQDTEVLVKPGERSVESIEERKEVKYNLCEIVRAVQNTRLRMQVDVNKLWHLRPSGDQTLIQDIRYSTFQSLQELLNQSAEDNETEFSAIEGRDRLILSFVLATSLLHLYEGPWLQKIWSNDDICFLINTKDRARLNLKNPYLTAICAAPTSKPNPTTLNQVHRYPIILALGILLLEIAIGTTLKLKESDDEKQDGRHETFNTDCLVALRIFEEWARESQRSVSRSIPLGLKSAIDACLNLKKLPDTAPPPNQEQVRQYIFAQVVIPLGTALATTYGIPLEQLHEEISKEKEVEEPDLFESYENKHGHEQIVTARHWFKRLEESVHGLLSEFDKVSEDHKAAGRVSVAVLDTGFEPSKSLMVNYEDDCRIKDSKTFLINEKDRVTDSESWRTDSDGHGTHVAQLLLRVAPVADVHIAKVFETRKDLNKPEIAATVYQGIADAINYAANTWKVDMIVMSFGFDEPVEIIGRAIDNACYSCDTRIKPTPLLFAATRNDGASKEIAWPARLGEVFGISSTDGDGRRSSFNPRSDHSDTIFYALGQAVEVACPPGGLHEPKNKKLLSGTSLSNPIAAGLAANLLGYVRLAARGVDSVEERVKLLDGVRSRNGMKGLLTYRMNRCDDRGLASLLPWEFLRKNRGGKNCILNEVQETLRKNC